MRNVFLKSVVTVAAVMLSAGAYAQQPPPAYGPPISLEMAKKAADAAAAEAAKNGWFLAIAVVSPSGDLVHFSKMDNTQYASIAIAIHKAKAAATFRRPTKAFQDGLTGEKPNLVLLTLDGVIASEGGVPIVVDGKIIGAIGASGATGAQDGQASMAGVAALK
jgi:glc operon protein GlcG